MPEYKQATPSELSIKMGYNFRYKKKKTRVDRLRATKLGTNPKGFTKHKVHIRKPLQYG